MVKSIVASESGTEPLDQARAYVKQFRLLVDGGPRFVSASDHATEDATDVTAEDATEDTAE